jgi:hypothetical protein
MALILSNERLFCLTSINGLGNCGRSYASWSPPPKFEVHFVEAGMKVDLRQSATKAEEDRQP